MFTITSRLVMAVTVPSTTSPTATFDSVLSYSSAICSFGWSYTPRSFSKGVPVEIRVCDYILYFFHCGIFCDTIAR